MTQCRRGRENIQKDTDKLKQWIEMNMPHLSNSLCKKDLDVLAEHKLNMSQKYDATVAKINVVLGTFTGPETRSWEVMVPILVFPAASHSGQFKNIVIYWSNACNNRVNMIAVFKYPKYPSVILYVANTTRKLVWIRCQEEILDCISCQQIYKLPH